MHNDPHGEPLVAVSPIAEDDPVRTRPLRRRRLLALVWTLAMGMAVAIIAPLTFGSDEQDAGAAPEAAAQTTSTSAPHAAVGPVHSVPSSAATPNNSTSGQDQRARRSVTTTIAAGRLLFVGASYSIGLGATRPGAAYPSLLAERLHRALTVNAISGTGFQNPGGRHHGGTFLERIGLIPTTPAPRIVIIQGGRDDVRFPLAHESHAVIETIEAAQERFQQAQIVVLGPIPSSLPVRADVIAINDVIAQACRMAGAGYVNAVGAGWITPENVYRYAGPIRGHPNDAGYAYIATRLLTALPAALKDSKAPLHGPALPTDPD